MTPAKIDRRLEAVERPAVSQKVSESMQDKLLSPSFERVDARPIDAHGASVSADYEGFLTYERLTLQMTTELSAIRTLNVCVRKEIEMSLKSGTGMLCLFLMGIVNSASAVTLELPLPAAAAFTTNIDNQYWPLPVGESFAYMAETKDGCEYNKLTVTPDVKVVNINGDAYTTRIIRDLAWESEDCDITTATLTEDTKDFYAMEFDSKNLWYFGEETLAIDEESDDCTDEGAWEAGVDGAVPGVVMLGDPSAGDRYQQEFSEDNAEDWGAVLRLNSKVSIESGEFAGCLVTREWTPLSPGEVEHKYYCPQPGNPGPGLMFIEELKAKTVYVEFIGTNLVLGAPGEFLPYPAMDDVGSCNVP